MNIFFMLFRKNKVKPEDMNKEKSYNESIETEAEIRQEETCPAGDGGPRANMAGGEETAADTMTAEASDEQPAPDYERTIAEWKDKYVRLHAEFDNYRKRTLREKMELVETGGQGC